MDPSTQKPLQFNGKAGGYFLVFLVTLIGGYIPILGQAFALNFMAGWFFDNTLINGRQGRFKATYGETLKFVFVNLLLIIVTVGIYIFWYIPKQYRYVFDHVVYDDAPQPSQSPMPSATTPAPAATPPTPPTVTDTPPAAPAPQPPTSTPPIS